MPYRKFVTVRMGDAMHADLLAFTGGRDLDVGKFIRQLIDRELKGSRDRVSEALDQVLFLAILIDGVYAEREPDLRAELVQVWRDRLAEEGRRHGA